MSGGSPFENTARVVRARLNRVERLVLETLTDDVRVGKDGAVLSWPTLSLTELCARTDYGVSSVQRALKRLEEKRLVRRFVRPGRTYLFQPLVSQLSLSLADAAQQAALPGVAREQPPPAATELEAHPASQWSRRGTQGRFVPVGVGAGDFHSFGTLYRSSPDELPLGDARADETGSVQSTDPIGTFYRSDRYKVPILGGALKEVQTQTQTESAAHGAADPPRDAPRSPATDLPMWGVPMTAEQREAARRDPAGDGNYAVLLALALHLGRTPGEARKHLAVPITTEGDLRDATKSAAARSGLRYDLTGPTGEGVIHAACFIAWKILCREGRFQFSAQEWRDEHARRHRRDRRRGGGR